MDQAPIFETQHCYTHNCQCKLNKDSHLEVAGLPCWDYSAAGKRRGENGPTIGTFLTHGKRRIAAATPLIIIENVQELLSLGVSFFLVSMTFPIINGPEIMYFKWDGLSTEWLKFQHSHPMGFVSLKNLKLKLIRLIYGEHYNIHVLRVSLDHVGHTGARRDRLYLVLNHKMRTQQLCNPNDLYMHIIDQVSKAVHTTVQDYFVSSLREIDIAAAELAATRRKFVPWIHGT